MRNSIRTRLTVAFISLAIGPLLLVGIILVWQSFLTQERQALDLQREVARHVAAELTTFFENLENELRLTGKTQVLPGLDQHEQYNLLRLFLDHDAFESLLLLDSQGNKRLHISRLGYFSTNLNHYAATNEFAIPKSTGEIYYGPVRFEEITGEPFMTIAVPLIDIRTGLVDGVLVSEVRLKKIWNLIADIQVGPGQSVYIVNSQGKVVAHRNPSVVLRGTNFVVPSQDGIQSGLAGERVVLAVDKTRFGDQEFNVVAEQAISDALALAINLVLITIVLIVAALLVSGTLGFLIVRQIVQPIQILATTAQAISEGDLSQQVPVVRHDELGVLANTFNNMTRQLRTIINNLEQEIAERKQAEAALWEKTEELNQFFTVSLDLLCIADLEGYFHRLNPEWEVVLGYSLPELEGQSFLDLVHPEDQAGTLAAISELNDQKVVLNFANRYRRKDGSYCWIEWRSRPVGGLIYAAARDITERKQAEEKIRQLNAELEQRVIERTAQLEAAQVELLRQERLAALGQLTATVSHEIRNPLATIRASVFTIAHKIQKKEYNIELVLDRIERNITRCDNIIAELLDFTRMRDLKLETVTFDDWLAQELDEQTIPLGITLSVDLAAGVNVILDRERFRRVIVNLIDNACQAMASPPGLGRSEQTVQIQSATVAEQVRLSIADTGPGITPEVMPHIFEPMYSTKNFGVGLGLPVVQEIVNQHGGRIEIHSEIGTGTQAVIWLPLNNAG